jgi:hypothetical protein
MKFCTSLFLVAAVVAGGAVGNVWAQGLTESETTITTAPVVPRVETTTSTVTTRSLVNPPAVVVNPPVAVVVYPPASISKSTSTTEEQSVDDDSDTESAQVLGTSRTGNTTIVFEAADNRDIRDDHLEIWDDFAQAHPAIASRLAYDPELINDPVYLARHPALNAFFAAHPDIKMAMNEDPGNFAAIPPRPGE